MTFSKLRYITHYFPLFDNTRVNGQPVDRSEEVVDGSVTFRRNGIAVLGEMGGFGFTREIQNVEFGGGYVANRSYKDQILVIKSPTEEVFRFRYVTRDSNWYRLIVVENASSQVSVLPHMVREDLSDYGPIIGSIIGLFRVVASLVLNLVGVVIVLAFLGGVFAFSVAAVHGHLGHLGPEVERLLIAVVWFVEALVVGILFLGDLASRRRTWLYRVILPLLFIGLIVWIARSGLIFDAVATYQNFERPSLGD